MNRNYKAYQSGTMNDLQKTCTKVTLMDKKTGEIFECIGIARLHPNDNNFDEMYGERLSFTRGLRGALKKARASLLPEYERIERQYFQLRRQLLELERRIDESDEYESDLLDEFVEDDSDDDDDDE